MVTVGLPSRSGSEAFREAVTQRWLPALEAFQPELLFISAGFDAHRDDPLAYLKLVDADYAWVTRVLLGVIVLAVGVLGGALMVGGIALIAIF